MKTAKATAAQEDDDEPRKIRSSRSKRRRACRSRSSSSSSSQSPPRKRSKKHSKRGIPDKKSKRSKVSSSSLRHRHRSLSPSSSRRHRHRSLGPSSSPSSSPSSVTRHSSSTSSSSSSASERSVSLPPRSRSRDVTRKKGRRRDRERDRKGRKVRRSTSSSGTSPSSGSDRSRSRSKGKSRKRRAAGGTKDGTTRDKIEKGYTNRHSSRSDKNKDDYVDRDEEAPATIAKKGGHDIHGRKKNVESELMESPPSKNANESEVALPAAGGANSDAEDLELILRKKALENFRKFRAAATMSGKTENLTTGKEASADNPQNDSTKIAEATHFQRQGSSLGVRHSVGSPRSDDRENGTGHSWKQESSAGMSRGAGSSGILEAGDAGVPTQQKGRTVEGTYSASQFRSPQDDSRNSRSVMQRLVSTPGSSASVNQRLGTSAGVSHVSRSPRVRSVVSIPAREGLDDSTHTTASRPSDDFAPVQSSSEVGLPLVDTNKAEGTNGENRKTSEASASNGSVPSPAVDKSQARIEDKDGFEKKTFSRMHDGETVEVSYKVYIPKKTPALARRKLQR
ncbi:hypothetical protein U9M48_011340 [Paspalum notatum var. saurae]|uniref:Uncharacterized protein n=1 Tax=Paspalum notatum var. saurae TaxID=547442 RepID=A0AAQ3WH22_PASNO